jgi:hypothetical protein
MASVLIVLLSLVACGRGGGDGGGGRAASETATSASTTRPRDPAPGESTTFGTVSTSTTLSRAERRLTSEAIPELENMETEFREASVNGVSYPNALIIDRERMYKGGPYTGSINGRVEINAGRDERRFLGDLGIPDDQLSATTWRVEISLDNSAPVFSTEVRFGETKKIDLDVTGVLRLRMALSMTGCCGTLAIGNPRFSS